MVPWALSNNGVGLLVKCFFGAMGFGAILTLNLIIQIN